VPFRALPTYIYRISESASFYTVYSTLISLLFTILHNGTIVYLILEMVAKSYCRSF
jgi:hypothetical protein